MMAETVRPFTTYYEKFAMYYESEQVDRVTVEVIQMCRTKGGYKEAHLQCPMCYKLGITESYFCSQECFKSSRRTHKRLHKRVSDLQNETHKVV